MIRRYIDWRNRHTTDPKPAVSPAGDAVAD